ncbi:PadR family transcriptional regulator [Motilibacter rhizosphaerae]|uniref:PadR family transcriptional regulator n=1 Tax=Motilibacter rhizosphaerae TaxID=598652 RepID=A0A4Q7NYN1_9ACTN|nr:PadR family transcriptional regulator [Motilibacter rhizosphaerae]RZS91512.1 PadR family transcriptional regulator [Motilibacter rhizosphaerae]
MSLRHAILGLLEVQPATGYALASRFEQSLGSAWHATHSQIYPELARLLDDGLVRVAGEGARRSKTYAITDEGRAALRDWLLESEPNRATRSETILRWFLLQTLPRDQRVAALERERASVGEQVTELQALLEVLADGDPHPFAPNAELGLRINTVMAAWLDEQITAARGR